MQPVVQRSVDGDQIRSGEVQLIADIDSGSIAHPDTGQFQSGRDGTVHAGRTTAHDVGETTRGHGRRHRRIEQCVTHQARGGGHTQRIERCLRQQRVRRFVSKQTVEATVRSDHVGQGGTAGYVTEVGCVNADHFIGMGEEMQI